MNMDSNPGVIDQRTFSAILNRFDKGLIGQSSGNAIKRMGIGYIFQPSGFYIEGVREGVKIRVVIEPATGDIITAFPVK